MQHGFIPFGDSIDEVISQVEGATVTEMPNGCHADFIAWYSLYDYFEGGFTHLLHTTRMSREVTQCFRVRSAVWPDIAQIELYFLIDGSRSELFMVRKVLRNPDVHDSGNVFEGLADAISDRLSQQPRRRWEVEEPEPAAAEESSLVRHGYVALWQIAASQNDIFLLVGRNSSTPLIGSVGREDASHPAVIYMSVPHWTAYVAAHREHESNRDRDERAEAATSITGF